MSLVVILDCPRSSVGKSSRLFGDQLMAVSSGVGHGFFNKQAFALGVWLN